MGSLLASTIIAKAQELMEDVDGVTYTTAQGLTWLNDAQRAICLVRPDAKSAIQSVALTTSASKQALPTGSRRLLGLVRNMGADGLTVGKAIRGPVAQEEMDGADPDWHTRTGSYVRSYVYDEMNPDAYYVYPTVASTWYVEAKLAKLPADVAAVSNAIDLGDEYAPPLLEWMLYCFNARDTEQTPNWTRAARHWRNFFDLLGVKTRSDMAVSPKVIEAGRQIAPAGG